MRLGVVYELICLIGFDLPISIFSLNNVSVLENLCKEIRLLKIVVTLAGILHILQSGEPGPGAACGIDVHKSVPCPVLVLGVPGRAVGIVIRLNHLGTQIVVAVGDPEAVLVVKVALVLWWVLATSGNVAPVPVLGANAGPRSGVRLVAAFCEFDTKVDVLLFAETKSTENKITARKTGHFMVSVFKFILRRG